MILAACSRSPSSVVEAPMMLVDGSAPPAVIGELTFDAGAAPELHAGARYQGFYYCPQGRTSMKLAIDDLDASDREHDVHATFSFDYTSPGATEVHGAFAMTGSWDPRTRALKLEPDEWTENPNNGWVMVGLKGSMSKNGQAINGTIDAAGCTIFSLKKDTSPPPGEDR